MKLSGNIIFGAITAVIILQVFAMIGFNVYVDTACLERGYPGGLVTWNYRRYCSKRYLSIYESPYISFDKAVPLNDRP